MGGRGMKRHLLCLLSALYNVHFVLTDPTAAGSEGPIIEASDLQVSISRHHERMDSKGYWPTVEKVLV
jgi:hypothetical protein